MSAAEGQARTFLALYKQLRARFRSDPRLPKTIHDAVTGNRAFGSRDRKLYRELIYTTLRHLPWIDPWLDRDPNEVIRRVAWLAAEAPATKAFRAAFAVGEPPDGDKAELLPAWFRAHCPEIFSGAELETQLRRAPLWLRLQTADSHSVTAELKARGWRCRRSTVLPTAIEVLDEADVTTTDAFQRGQVEIQDLGSQLLLETIGLQPGETWFDACAGAGGKSLQLATLLGPEGHVAASDVRPFALAELETRAARAGLKNIRVWSPPAASTFAGVLVDAPCSGSGTWRRYPHLKWLTQPETIDEKAALQGSLLARFAQCVRPGGRLVYATCSLSPKENEEVVAAFLAQYPGFRPEPFARTFGATPRGAGLLFLPAQHDTDGFFVASLRRK